MSSDDETDSVIEVTFRNLDASTLADFKLLNQAIFPVKYSVRPLNTLRYRLANESALPA